jgi:hypothetical protein
MFAHRIRKLARRSLRIAALEIAMPIERFTENRGQINMSKIAKIMLQLSIVCGVTSALIITDVWDVSALPGLYVTFPLAVVFFGMFLICRALEKEVAAFDAEHGAHKEHSTHAQHSKADETCHDHEPGEPVRA